MKKNKWIVPIGFLLLGLSCSACTMPELSEYFDFSSLEIETPKEKEAAREQVSAYTQEQQEIIDLLEKKNTEGLSEEEYNVLFEKLETMGIVSLARDVLEEQYQIYKTPEALTKLSEIVVPLEAEDASLLEIAENLFGFLGTQETYTQAIEVIESMENFLKLMPNLHEGMRKYCLSKDGANVLYIEVGYVNASPVFKIIALPQKGKIVVMEKSNGMFTLYEENSKEYWDISQFPAGEMEASFAKTVIDLAKETLSVETGTRQDGKLFGTYHAEVALFDSYNAVISDIYDKREWLAYTEYDGEFDKHGKTLVEQPSEDILNVFAKSHQTSNAVVYALSKDGKRALHEGMNEAEVEGGKEFTEALILPNTKMPWSDIKNGDATWIPKTALTVQGSNEIKVKILNGQLLVFDGKAWANMGSAENYVEADPFYQYANAPISDNPDSGTIAAASEERGAVTVGVLEEPKQGSTTIPTVTPTPTTPTKPATGTTPSKTPTTPATTKPATTPTPAVTPTPSAPDPEPSNPDPGPQDPPSTPDPPAQDPPSTPDPPPSGGGDEGGGDGGDIPWSPDLL